MDTAKVFRENEKLFSSSWNSELYRQLNELRYGCGKIYDELRAVKESIKAEHTQMYVSHEVAPQSS